MADADLRYTSTTTPTGRSLFIPNLSAEASLTNNFRYIKELLMQRHTFYLNTCRELLTEHGVEIYTVKTDAVTIQHTQRETARELLNLEEGSATGGSTRRRT